MRYLAFCIALAIRSHFLARIKKLMLVGFGNLEYLWTKILISIAIIPKIWHWFVKICQQSRWNIFHENFQIFVMRFFETKNCYYWKLKTVPKTVGESSISCFRISVVFRLLFFFTTSSKTLGCFCKTASSSENKELKIVRIHFKTRKLK